MGIRTPNLVKATAHRWPTGPATPTCHPDRKHQAKGLCRPCYQAAYIRKRQVDPHYKAGKRKNGRDYIARHPDKPRRDWLKHAYRIEPDAYEAMLAGQAGRCLICKRDDRRLVIDHDHSTQEVRGLLCGQCNAGLGFMNDDPAVLLAAVAYLTRGR